MIVLLRGLLLTVIAAIIGNAAGGAINHEKMFENQNLVEIINLLGPKNFARVLEDTAGTNYMCGRDLMILKDALTKGETWAMKMWDASSKIPAGIGAGNVVDLGMFDECINTKDVSQGVEIRGQHCMYSISSIEKNVTHPVNYTLSTCMPSTCNATDIIYLFNSIISRFGGLKDLGLTITSATCTPAHKEIWDREFIVCSSIFAVFIGFLLLCTLIDVLLQSCDPEKYKHSVISTLAMFSFRYSISSILSTDIQEGSIPAVNGIRFFTMVWIILGHEYVAHLLVASVNNIDKLNWIYSWKSLHYFTCQFGVDTFITLTGFLTSYLFLKQMSKQKSFNLPLYYLHRYLRLTPAVIGLVIFTVGIGSKMGTGPRWDTSFTIYGESCREKWWPFLFYIQNFVNRKHPCLGHLWYIAMDMQLFWISPIILYPLHKKPKLGLAIFIIFFLASVVTPAALVGFNKYPALIFFENGATQLVSEAFFNVYTMPYNRTGPWLLGILLGFEVVNNNRKLGKFAVFVGWLITIGAFSFCALGTRSFIQPDYEYNVTWETVFAAVSRHIWAVGICWIIYACLHGHAGPLSIILSWRIFSPFSKISYSVFLLHSLFLILPTASQRNLYYFSDILILREFIADLIISIVVGFLFCLVFESPIMTLEKIIFGRKSKNVKSKKNLISEHCKDKQS